MSQIPRDPSEYRLSIHAEQRRRSRNVPPDAVVECIENGDRQESSDDGIKLRAKYGGVSYWAVVAPENGVVESCGVCG